MGSQMQIGEVAERTGLSLRTIRYYGEVNLVTPSSRTEGGFRLYTDRDITTLEVIKKLKPLEYSLDEMREVLDLLAALETRPDVSRQEDLADELAAVRSAAETRRDELAAKLAAAESFITQLDQYSAST